MLRSRTSTMTTGMFALAIVGWSLLPYPVQGLPAAGDDTDARGPAPAERISGRVIADRVLERLSADPAVDGGALGVVVVDGQLTISGTTASLAAKERAERLAEEVRGVTSVTNRIRVQPTGPHTDRQVEHYVARALASEPALAAYDIGAKVKRGVVTLRGTVSNGAERRLVRELAADVFAVRAIEDQLTLRSGMTMTKEPAEAPGADERRQEIEQALAWDARIHARALEVQVEGSTAVLKGAVATLAERRRAIEAAYVAGIHDVDARGLEVVPSAGERARDVRPNASLADAIARSFARHPRLAESQVSVGLDVGAITLRGVVDSLAARRAASEVALSHAGVSEVRNRLRVDPALQPMDADATVTTVSAASATSASDAAMPPVEHAAAPPVTRLSDEELANEVREALRRDPYLHTKSIRVDVVAGEAYLDGEVASAFERARAAEVVGRVRGVRHLHEELEALEAMAPTSSTKAALACE